MLYFAIARLIFMLYNFEFAQSSKLTEILLSFIHGGRQDASITGYFLLIPTLIIILTSYFPTKFLKKFFNFYTVILLIISSLLIVSDAELYKNWGFRMDATPLLYITSPKDAMASVNIITSIKILAITISYLGSFIFIYFKFIPVQINKIKPADYKTSLIFTLIFATLILPIRSSVGIAPMNTGMIYFSEKNMFVNHAAINLVWNVGYAITKMDNSKEINFFDDKVAEKYFKELYPNDNNLSSSQKIFKNEKPNIVLIILESFTAKIIEPLGGKNGVTPNLEQISKEGILFTNFYATGDRTDKGIPAILSGYPAQPTSSIVKFSGKTEKLPTLTQKLQKIGYSTQWICGFDINFANLKSYLIHNKFDNIITIDDFPKPEKNTKWGIHDHVVFNKLLEECKKSEAPYFKVFMTLSSHEPFDVPMETVIEGDDDETRFLNSAYYTDKYIGEFIDKMKKLPSWSNTIVIFVADHGSRHPGNTKMHLPQKFHIPMVWVGGALQMSDTLISKYSSQTDIATTILSQLRLPANDFIYSKNIFSNKSKSFAFYDFNNGFGFLTDSSTQVYNNHSNKYILENNKTNNKTSNHGKAYLQYLLKDFSSK